MRQVGKSVRKKSTGMPAKAGGRRVVENVNVPGYTSTVDAAKYEAMLRALFKVLPSKPPGLTQAEMFRAVLPHLPQDQFPGGAKAAWWVKAVQLDQEAKGALVREPSKPLRWHRRRAR